MAPFCQEREFILKDIKDFLIVLFRFLRFVNEPNDEYKNFNRLIKSLYLIHSWYTYPANGDGLLENKNAVREFMRELKFEEVYPKFDETEEPWKIEEEIKDLPREPAHVFLELVREIFTKYLKDNFTKKLEKALTEEYKKNLTKTFEVELTKELEEAAKLAKKYLGELPDCCRLKPAVCARHKSQHEIFGVSIGCRRAIRPLFLYIKLSKLRDSQNNNNEGTSIKLSDTEAFKAIQRGPLKSETCSPFIHPKDPCLSCKIFFGYTQYDKNIQIQSEQKRGSRGPSLSPFGNCAEYDVIRTPNLGTKLKSDNCKEFESACHKQFKAFKEYITSKKAKESYMDEMTENSKILLYKKKSDDNFEICSQDFPISKGPRKRKRCE